GAMHLPSPVPSPPYRRGALLFSASTALYRCPRLGCEERMRASKPAFTPLPSPACHSRVRLKCAPLRGPRQVNPEASRWGRERGWERSCGKFSPAGPGTLALVPAWKVFSRVQSLQTVKGKGRLEQVGIGVPLYQGREDLAGGQGQPCAASCMWRVRSCDQRHVPAMGSYHSASAHPPFCIRKKEDNREDLLAEREQEEAIAQFPYVEFTGRDSITCLTCQGTGYIPTGEDLGHWGGLTSPWRIPRHPQAWLSDSCLLKQVNELVALIPHSDQRLRPQRTKQYVLLSILLCLLASGLVVFFLFPHSVLVDNGGVRVEKVTFNKQDSLVILAITATLKIRNSNFYPVAVTSLSSQVQYMNTVVGTYVTTNVSFIPPRSEQLVNFTTKAEMGGPYVYFFCTLPDILVHNIVIFMRTSVKISYIGRVTQSSLETHQYVDCGANATAL
ncbi:Transmembrane protein 106C, partial [Galemys pyrenaicus]